MLNTGSNHFGIVIESKNKSEQEKLYLEDKQEDLITFKAIRKVYEVNNHRSSDQLVEAYRNA